MSMDTSTLYTQLVHGNYSSKIIEDLSELDINTLDYLALAYALQRNLKRSREILDLSIAKSERTIQPSKIRCEAQLILLEYLGKKVDAEKLAIQILQNYPESYFSHSFLANLAITNREYHNALSHYNKILEVYPEHDKVILNIAMTMVLNKNKYNDALMYRQRARPSFRRTMQLMFIPLGNKLVRFLWLVTIVSLFLIPHVGSYIFAGLIAILLILLFFSLRKVDIVVTTRIIFLLFSTMLIFVFDRLLVFLW
jgi:tetratricopeptide (TPR) repeat protein